MCQGCGVIALPFNPILESQSPLERGALEGDSPVNEFRRMWQDADYCSSDIEQELGVINF